MQVSILNNHHAALLFGSMVTDLQECLREGILSKAIKSKPVLSSIKFVFVFGLKCAKK